MNYITRSKISDLLSGRIEKHHVISEQVRNHITHNNITNTPARNSKLSKLSHNTKMISHGT